MPLAWQFHQSLPQHIIPALPLAVRTTHLIQRGWMQMPKARCNPMSQAQQRNRNYQKKIRKKNTNENYKLKIENSMSELFCQNH